jgi:thioredoxin-related protein/YHS domain-containing protein
MPLIPKKSTPSKEFFQDQGSAGILNTTAPPSVSANKASDSRQRQFSPVHSQVWLFRFFRSCVVLKTSLARPPVEHSDKPDAAFSGFAFRTGFDMRTAFRAIVFLSATVGLTIGSASISSADEIRWSTDIEQSLQSAAQSGKPVLMEFTASWCVYCKRMEKSTFTDPRVAAQIEEQFVAVRVDADKHKDLVKDLEIEGLPAILIVSPELKIIHRIKGFQTANALLTELNKVPQQTEGPAVAESEEIRPAVTTQRPPRQNVNPSATRRDTGFEALTQAETADTSRRKPAQAAARPVNVPAVADRAPGGQTQTGPAGRSDRTTAAAPKGAAKEAVAGEDDNSRFFESLQTSDRKPVARPVSHAAKSTAAFGGSSLVAAVDDHEILPGSPKHQLTYRNQLLYFQSEEEKAAFQANPNKYWPMLDGDCAVTLANDEEHVAGELQFAAVFRKRVWLFSSEANMREFLADPADTVEAAQEVLAESRQ